MSASQGAKQDQGLIAIAGISGFIGQALKEQLRAHYSLVGLSRQPQKNKAASVAMRACDLFSLKQAEEALCDVDVAIYLVHSMAPQAGLTQAQFEDLDLICADNFARAAQKNGVKRILYLSGLIPEGVSLSHHLRSRKEVEDALASHGVPVTVLRAGLVIGWAGSSFQIMYRLVKHLPAMICPRWVSSQTEPIALDDVIKAFQYCLDHPETTDQIYDLSGGDQMTYAELMQRTARFLQKNLRQIAVPFFSPRLSVLWVRLVTGASQQLIQPLVESLRHNMVSRANHRLPASFKTKGFEESLALALKDQSQAIKLNAKPRKNRRDVRSVQRLSLPANWNAWQVSQEYMKWLGEFFSVFFKVKITADRGVRFYARGLSLLLLELRFSEERSTLDRPIFYITGGALNQSKGPARLEFREVLQKKHVLAAIHDYEPRLPWRIYNLTQAKVHAYVMRRFEKHLKRQ